MDEEFDSDLGDERSPSRSPRRRSRASSSDSSHSRRGRDPSSSPARSETPAQILTMTSRTKRAVTTKFILAVNKGERTVNSVAVAGTFTSWIAIPLYFANGYWEARLGVDPGTHQYKFIVDGLWIHDDDKHNVANDQGSRNNTLVIFPGANVAEVPSSVLKHVKSGKVFRYSEKREAAARAKKEAKEIEAARIEAGLIKYAAKQEILTPLKETVFNPNVDAFVPKHLQTKEQKLSEIREKNEMETTSEEAIKENTSEEAIKWKVGDECVAKWRGRYWYNGRILEIIHDQVLVEYLDCGDEDYASLDELKPAGSLTEVVTLRDGGTVKNYSAGVSVKLGPSSRNTHGKHTLAPGRCGE